MQVPTGDGSPARKFIYRYDNEGRLVGTDVVTVTGLGGTATDVESVTSDNKSHFFYDDSADRVKMINKAGDVYYFVYDPTADVPAVVYEQGPTKRFINVRDPGGALISRERYNGTSYAREADYTYHFDGLGSTVALTDDSDTVTDRYSYDAWGNVTHTYGTTADNPYQYVGQLGYYTHYQESTLTLLQLGVRYYDSGTGRFTQQDPIGDGLNWYEYAGGNPTGWVDPWGERTVVFYYSRIETHDWHHSLRPFVFDSGYFDAKSKDVQMIPILHARAFVDAWNNLDDRDIDDIYIYFHGTPGRLQFMSNSAYEDKLTFQRYDTENEVNFNPAGYTCGDLRNKKVKGSVYLLACSGGEGPEKDNVAWMFARKTGTSVVASPLGVSFYRRAGKYYAEVAPHSNMSLNKKLNAAFFSKWQRYGYDQKKAVMKSLDFATLLPGLGAR